MKQKSVDYNLYKERVLEETCSSSDYAIRVEVVHR